MFSGAYKGGSEERPVIFDILSPNLIDSVLPLGLKLVLHYNPSSLNFSYAKNVNRIQTKGGWVEQHWGDTPSKLTLQGATGGFKRLYSGLSNTTAPDSPSRRETLAYDRYLDLMALFRNNGVVYDSGGQPVFAGAVKVTFDEGVYIGWFDNFSVTEEASTPYQFKFDLSFTIKQEVVRIHSIPFTAYQAGGFQLGSGDVAFEQDTDNG